MQNQNLFGKRRVRYIIEISFKHQCYGINSVFRLCRTGERCKRGDEHKLFGVVNGIDYNEFNPVNDKNIKTRYDSDSLEKKRENKKALQKRCSLEINDQLPILVMSSRIAEQKGLDLLLPLIPYLLNKDLQLIILGDGDKKYIENFKEIAKKGFLKKLHKVVPWCPRCQTPLSSHELG